MSTDAWIATALLAANLVAWWVDRRRWQRLIDEAEDRVIDAIVASPLPPRELIAESREARAARRRTEVAARSAKP